MPLPAAPAFRNPSAPPSQAMPHVIRNAGRRMAVAVLMLIGAAAMVFGAGTAAAAAPTTPALLRPDLVVPSIDNSVRIEEGNVLIYRFTVKNRSSSTVGVAAASTASVRMQPVVVITVDGRRQYLNAFDRPAVTMTGTVDKLAAGESRTEYAIAPTPATAISGLYQIRVCADSAAAVAESDELNNCSTVVTNL